MRVLAIAGSLRDSSYNRALARAARNLAPAGVEIELYDGLALVPPYDADADGEDAPETVRELRSRIAAADALLIVTPEYNGSIPGVLKNAIDWASRPHREAALWDKTTAIAGATTGSYGAVWALADLRRVLGIAGARVIDSELGVSQAHTRFDEDGRLGDSTTSKLLRQALESLAEAALPLPTAA